MIHYNAEAFYSPFLPDEQSLGTAEGMKITTSPSTPASGEAPAV